MYRRFAGDQRMRVNLGIRRRLGPLLQDDRRRVELMNGLLFSLLGTPIIYYGDEIGMGDNVYLGDRDAVRTPMQWSGDRNAGFSTCNPQQLFLPLVMDPQHHFDVVNVEAQRRNPSSLWWWMRRLVILRRRQRAFGRGSMRLVETDNPKVLAFLRSLGTDHRGIAEDDDMLVVANLSRHPQDVTLATTGALAEHAGSSPVEMFGQSTFAPLSDGRHRMTLGPYDFFWLRLPTTASARRNAPTKTAPIAQLPPLRLSSPLDRRQAMAVAGAVSRHLERLNWFGSRSRTLADLWVVDHVPLRVGQAAAVIVEADFTAGEPERFFIVLDVERRHEVDTAASDVERVVTPIAVTADDRAVIDATTDPAVARRMLQLVLSADRLPGWSGAIAGRPRRRAKAPSVNAMPVRTLEDDDHLATAVIDEASVLKFYRRVDVGIHPDAEVLQHLTAMRFPNSPPLLGTLEYAKNDGRDRMILGTLTEFIPNEGTADDVLLDNLARFLEWAVAAGDMNLGAPETSHVAGVPDELRESVSLASLLGRRTAELHVALATIREDRFRPEAFTRLGQRALYQALRSRARAVYGRVARVNEMPPLEALLGRYERITDHLLDCDRVRLHGDLHLAQVLVRGSDVVFVDFEGLSDRPVGERAIKRSTAVDLTSMIRSFERLAERGLDEAVERGVGPTDSLTRWSRAWADWTSHMFVESYVGSAVDHPAVRLLPGDPADRRLLLEVFVLDGLIAEFDACLHRPTGAPRDLQLRRLRRELARRLT
jgi:maltose alpha-D-glucosyltransferase / alpha-amylase